MAPPDIFSGGDNCATPTPGDFMSNSGTGTDSGASTPVYLDSPSVESLTGKVSPLAYTCNLSDDAHIWNAPGLLPLHTAVTPATTEFVTPRYTLRLVSDDGVNIISSLTVISDVGFNDTNVTCADARGDEIQQTLAIVFGEKGFMGR